MVLLNINSNWFYKNAPLTEPLRLPSLLSCRSNIKAPSLGLALI